jgi:nitroreductase
MELTEALRSTGAVREFRPDPVPEDVVHRILDTARFAPSGGNRQAWRVVLMEDPEARRRLRGIYLSGWYEYLAQAAAGLVPWAPLTDEEAEREAIRGAGAVAGAARGAPGGFAEHLDEVPVLLVVLAELGALAAVDRDLGRYGLAGGASVYPFVWSILLAARAEGLAGVITTMAIRDEPALRRLVGAPDSMAVAAVVALGRAVTEPSRLRRNPVENFATVDTVGGRRLAGPPA